MAESTITLTIAEIKGEIAHKLGYGRTAYTSDADNTTAVNRAYAEGFRNFVSPPPMPVGGGENAPRKRHRWSFLQITRNITIASGATATDLTDDFAGIIEGFAYNQASDLPRITVLPEHKVIAMRSDSAAAGPIRFAGIRRKTMVDLSTTSDRWEVVTYPIADANYTLTYRHHSIPDTDSPGDVYPIGGGLHSSTLLQSCLAAAEMLDDDERGPEWARFLDLLSASIDIDMQSQPTSTVGWVASGQTTGLIYQYLDFSIEVGHAMGYGYDVASRSYDQQQAVDLMIHAGCKQVYAPPRVGDQRIAHQWSFLEFINELATTAAYETGQLLVNTDVATVVNAGGTWPSWAADGELTIKGVRYNVLSRDSDTILTLSRVYAEVSDLSVSDWSLSRKLYELADSVGGIEGDFTFVDDQNIYDPVQLISDGQFREIVMRNDRANTGQPQFAVRRWKISDGTTQQKSAVEFWPIPDQVYTMEYRGYNVATPLSTTNPFPLGGELHSELYLAAMLYCVEKRHLKVDNGPREKEFMTRLMASIDIDGRRNFAQKLGYNGDNSDFGGQYNRRLWLSRARNVTFSGTKF